MSESPEEYDQMHYARMIREAKEQCFQARRALRGDLPDPDTETMRALAIETAAYFDALLAYLEESAERPDGVRWQERLPVDPERLVGETVEIEEVNKVGRTQRRETREVPVATQMDPGDLIELGKELDKTAVDLGFGAETADPVPNAEITNELVKEAEQWRQAHAEE
jgi:hypothetical protein